MDMETKIFRKSFRCVEEALREIVAFFLMKDVSLVTNIEMLLGQLAAESFRAPIENRGLDEPRRNECRTSGGMVDYKNPSLHFKIAQGQGQRTEGELWDLQNSTFEEVAISLGWTAA